MSLISYYGATTNRVVGRSTGTLAGAPLAVGRTVEIGKSSRAISSEPIPGMSFIDDPYVRPSTGGGMLVGEAGEEPAGPANRNPLERWGLLAGVLFVAFLLLRR